MSMFYDNRVNQIRERRRVLNSIRSQLEAYENGEETDLDPEADMPSPYLHLKVLLTTTVWQAYVKQ